MKKLRVTVGGKVYEVTVEVLADDTLGIPPKHVVIPPPPEVSMPSPTPAAPPVSKAPGNVVCPIAGKVVAIPVHAGQNVKEGDQLIVLEAMKMNNYIYAPRSGQITGLYIQVGDVMEEGHLILTIS